MTQHLDQQTIDAFRKNGATVLRGVFSDWIEALRKGVDFNMDNPGPDGKIYRDEETGGRFLSDYCNWQRIPEYRDFIFNSPAAEIGAELMGSAEVRLFHEHVLVKEAKAGIATPWHQDQPYYCVEGPKTVSLWVPLDDVPRERTLEFVAGSHLSGKYYRPQRFNGQALNENDGLEEIPDINANRDQYEILGWVLAPGDAVAFDYRTVHGAPANNSPSAQRRAFSLRLVGDDARFARYEGIISSPPFRDVALKHGDALDVAEFPVLRHGAG
ncbi:phytanoyl-CoA dioxygenase family protein [Rhodobacteraceae bacterium NNCM2]|nr:phytanoyl-CoA dioxygenase family protein [Coraliihabitans acroporae]